MRRLLAFALPLTYLVFAACVGQDAGPASNETADGGASDGTGNTDPSNDDASTTTTTDDGGSADSGPPPCGYPGETCCAAPSLPCRTGTTCSTSTNKCMVNELAVIGNWLDINASPPFHIMSAFYDGVTWSTGPDIMTQTGFGGFSASDLVAAGPGYYFTTLWDGDEGKLFNYSSALWRKCEPGQACPGPLLPMPALWSVALIDNDMWLVAENTMYRCVFGTNCTKQNTGLESTTWASGKLVGTGPQDIWFALVGRAFHFDGTSWTIHSNIKSRAIHQVRKDDVWVGDKTLQHWDGSKWSDEYAIDGTPAPGNIMSMSGSSSTDVWAVGYNGSDGAHPMFAAHWDGKTWSKVALPAGAAEWPSVWAPSPIEAYIASNSGVYKWDGTAWTKMTITLNGGAQPAWDLVAGPAKPRP